MSDGQGGIGAKPTVEAVGEIDEIGIGMLGYAFMGKAHSNAFRKIAYMTWPPPLMPRLVAIAGRDQEAVAGAARRYGYERWTTDWRDLVDDPTIGLFDNGGPNSLHAEPTIAAAEAGKHVLCEKPLGRDADESYDIWQRVAATGVKHLCAFNYRFVPAVRLAREMIEAGELGEIRHFRGRYLQDWGDDPTLDTWRFDAAAAGSGALGDLGAHVIDLARFLVGDISTVSALVHTFLPGRAGRRRDRGGRRVRARRDRDDRGDAARARPPQCLPVGDQRHQGVARLRHGEAERAPGLPRRRRPGPRVQDRARLGGRSSLLGVLVAARAHHRLGRDVRPRDPPSARGRSPRTPTWRRTVPRSKTATGRRRCARRSSARARAGDERRSRTADRANEARSHRAGPRHALRRGRAGRDLSGRTSSAACARRCRASQRGAE